jgi:hypothetical protein
LGAPRIHGELLKLGIDIGETSVGKYLYARGSQGKMLFTPAEARGLRTNIRARMAAEEAGAALVP